MPPGMVDATNLMYRAIEAVANNQVPGLLPELRREKAQARYEFNAAYNHFKKQYDEAEAQEEYLKKRLLQV